MYTILKNTSVLFRFSVSKFNPAKDYYQILNLSSSADQKQIKKAFRDLAKKYHPDTNKGNQDKFKEVNQAYQVLSSQIDKKDYDQTRNYQKTRSQNPYNSQNGSSNSGQYTSNSYYNDPKQYQQNPYSSSDYRGYQKASGWQNTQQRDRMMYEMFRKQQQNLNSYNKKYTQQAHKQGRSNYSGGFAGMYQNSTINPQNIKKYTEQIKAKQQAIRKAYAQQQRRRQKQFKQFKQKQYINVKEQLQKKMYKAAEGFTDNVKGFIKMGDFVKGIWKDAKQTIFKDLTSSQKNNKNKK